METVGFATVALAILIFGLVSGRLQRTIVTAPMVFVALGLLTGAWGLGVIHLSIESGLLPILGELTLILILFTDASRIDLKLLRLEHDIPVRLLVAGLPLTILLGLGIAVVLFGKLEFWEAAVLAVMLAPTDAALGQAVVSSTRVPVRIRQALNVESGLNDGIVLPIILLFLSLASAEESAGNTGYWIRFTALQLVVGPVIGVVVGYAGGKLVARATKSGWMNDAFQRLSALGLALLAYAAAQLLGGNGFIAAFVAGLTVGNTSRAVCHCLFEFAEAEGQLLTLLVFMAFGAVIVPEAFRHLSWQAFLYAGMSLTVVRMIPTGLSLIGMRLKTESVLFLGWFGPRGLASILFSLLLLEEFNLNGGEEIITVVMLTVLVSVFAHGVTAVPWANWYAARAEEIKEGSETPEHVEVSEMPVRIRHRT